MSIEKAAQILKRARYPLFLSGAGISAESGIPTFRGKEGLWREHRAEKTGGRESRAATMASMRAEDLATPEAFQRDPALVWQWYNWRKRLISEKKPNPAHFAIRDIAHKLPNLLCATQNVDGFHALAGLEGVLEMHGNIFRTRCLGCSDVRENRGEIDPETLCVACNQAALRPDVVWFGEALPQYILHTIYERLHVCDAIIVVGTSGSVYPAAGFAVEVRRREGHVIEINIDETHRPYANDVYIRAKAGEALPQICALI